MSRPVAILVGLALVAFLGVTDHITGPEMSFSIFYLIPISFVTVTAGRRAGMVVVVCSAITWLTADLTSGNVYSHRLIPYWNTTVRGGYFFLHCYILDALLTAIKHEKEFSMRDSLTGAASWRYFEEYASKELQKARRTGKLVTVAYIDLDNFKAVNDKLGHGAGDAVLQAVVQTLKTNTRPSDMAARLGGDEFGLFLPETDYDAAHSVLSRIHESLLNTMSKNGWAVSFSIGAVTFSSPLPLDVMLQKADDLMYSVKSTGKNRLEHEMHELEATIP